MIYHIPKRGGQSHNSLVAVVSKPVTPCLRIISALLPPHEFDQAKERRRVCAISFTVSYPSSELPWAVMLDQLSISTPRAGSGSGSILNLQQSACALDHPTQPSLRQLDSTPDGMHHSALRPSGPVLKLPTCRLHFEFPPWARSRFRRVSCVGAILRVSTVREETTTRLDRARGHGEEGSTLIDL